MPSKPLSIQANYHGTARSVFSTPLMAMRELLDNTLAPSSQRNKPITGDDRPIRVNIDLATREFRRNDENDTVSQTYIQWGSDGQPIHYSDVASILDLGHKRVEGQQEEPLPEVPVYGRHGHGQLFAYLALSQFTVWLGKANINGVPERWAAVVGPSVNSKDNYLLNVTYRVPPGAKKLQDLLAMDPEKGAPPFEELSYLLQMLGGSNNRYVSPFYDARDFLQAYESMEEKGETLRAFIFLDDTNAAALAPTENDIVWTSGSTQKSLSREILGWYMPLPVGMPSDPHLQLRLREHLRAPPMDPPPEISLQGSPPLDGGLCWREQMQNCIDNIGANEEDVPFLSPVLTLELGDHVIKYQVLEKPSSKDFAPTQPEPDDGFIVYSDSDHFIKGPFEPLAASKQRDYTHKLEVSAPSRLAYLELLSMMGVKEEEVKELGLPTCKDFLNCKWQLKPLLRRLGGREVTTFIMLDRRVLAERNLLISNKSDFSEACIDIWHVLFRAQAQAVWQRHAHKVQQLQQQHRQQQQLLQEQQQQQQQQQRQQQQQLLHKPEPGAGGQLEAGADELLAAFEEGRFKASAKSRQQKQQEQQQQRQEQEQRQREQQRQRQQQRGMKRGRTPLCSPAQTLQKIQQQAVQMASEASQVQSTILQSASQPVQGASQDEQKKRLKRARDQWDNVDKTLSKLSREARQAKKCFETALDSITREGGDMSNA